MIIERDDNEIFVNAVARESLPSALPHKKIVDKVKDLQKAHLAEFCSITKLGGSIHLAFSNAEGYLLGETVRKAYGSKGKYIWLEKLKSGRNWALVCIDGESIIEEVIFDTDHHFDPFVMAQIFDPENLPIVKFFGDFPPQLDAYLNDHGSDINYENSEISLLAKLPLYKDLYSRDIERALESLFSQKGSGVGKIAVVCLILVGVVVTIYLNKSAEDNSAPVVDKFSGYRTFLQDRSATSKLYEIYEILKITKISPFWDFKLCELESGPLVCTLNGSLGSRTTDFYGIESQLSRKVFFKHVDEVVHAIIPLETEVSPRNATIVKKEDVIRDFYDRVMDKASPNQIKLLAPADEGQWGNQIITVAKSNTGLYFIADVGDAANGLPINLSKIKYSKDGLVYNISIDLIVFGSNK